MRCVFGDDEPAERLTLPALRIVGTQWFDGDRFWKPRFHSHLYALGRAITVEDWRACFVEYVAMGFNGVRVFAGQLDLESQGGGLTPALARERLAEYLDIAAEYGLVVEVVPLTGTRAGYDIVEHVREVSRIVAGRQSVIVVLANEFEHPTQNLDQATLVDLGQSYCAPLGILWAVGAPFTDEPTPDGIYPGAGGRYCTAHLDRGRAPRRVREIYAVVETQNVPCLNDEPLGADELDGSVTRRQRSNDPGFFFVLGALDEAFEGVGGTHHSQAGLMAQPSGPVQIHCAAAYLRARAAVRSCLGDVEGQYYNTGHDGSPVGPIPDDIWAETYGKTDGRVYSFTVGDRGVTIHVDAPAHNVPATPWQDGWTPVGVVARMTRHDANHGELITQIVEIQR